MSPLDVADNKVADTQRASPAYVPPLQRTEGQPPPIAAHGGLSYMSFDRDGDAGTAAALQDALAEIAEGPARYRHDRQGAAGPDQDQMGPCVPRLRRVRQVHPRVEQHQSPAGRGRAAAALDRLRAADLLGGAVQRCLAGPGARRYRGNPAQE